MRLETLKLTRADCESRMLELRDSTSVASVADPRLKDLRATIERVFEETNRAYERDVETGLAIHAILPIISTRLASDVGFWRWISLELLPHVALERWDLGQEDRLWTNKRRRLWPMQIWWYVHLARQESVAATRALLRTNGFSTDSIVAIVERPGGGYRVELIRAILRELAAANAISQENLRRVMMLNTARTAIFKPEYHADGLPGFARFLISETVPG